MAGVSPTIQQLPTPSPFAFSVASTRWSSRPPIQLTNLFLRVVALVLAIVAVLVLATTGNGSDSSSFDHPLIYCLIVSSLAFLYSAFQVSKGFCDMSGGCDVLRVAISDKVFDYLSFILDQLVAYLLISSSSVGIQAIQKTQRGTTIWKGAIISVSMSFATFTVLATCALLSGYKLCKRIIW